MTMDCTGPAGEFGLNNMSWSHAFKLARMHGWEPVGTLPPEEWEGEWNGNYFMNSGQSVTAEDAANLAEALEQALPDLPDHDALQHKAKPIGNTGEYGIPIDTPIAPFEWFSGDRKKYLQEFIRYCRAGGFTIW